MRFTLVAPWIPANVNVICVTFGDVVREHLETRMKRTILFLALVPVLAGCGDTTAPSQVSAVPALSQFADPAWVDIAPMPLVRFAHASAADTDGRIYVFSGFSSAALTDGLVYEPVVGEWAPIASPGAHVLSGAARGGDGRLYLVGGADAALQPMRTVQAYDPALQSWSPVAPLGTARHTLAVTAGTDGRIYALGGTAGGSASLTVAEVYDLANDRWTAIAPMAVDRQGHAAATGPDGRIFVVGGLTSLGPTASGEVYNPAANSWSPIASLPHYRYGLAAAAGADGLIYVFGGFADGVRLSTVQAYDPVADAWTDKPSMSMGRYLPAAARANDGALFVTGGNTPSGLTNSVEMLLTVSPNRAPLAHAGPDLTLECVHGSADARLDASGSSDPDGDLLSYAWLENGAVIASGVDVTLALAPGAHEFVLRVSDDAGAVAEDAVVVTVADSRPPTIAFDQLETDLQQPNHELRLVARVAATDECDLEAPALDVSVSMTEEGNGSGDGNTSPDWLVVPVDGGFEVWVRAERAGSSGGRVYTIVATARDHAGNESMETGIITVKMAVKKPATMRL